MKQQKKLKKLLAMVMVSAAVLAAEPTATAAGGITWIPGGDNVSWSIEGETMTISGTGEIEPQSTDLPIAHYHKVDIREGITGIADYIFLTSEEDLTEVTMADSVTRLGVGAFSYCNKLTGIRLSNQLTKIEYETFYSCSSLPEVSLPSSVASIGEMAFANCSSLKAVDIPGKVTSREYKTFYSCSSLPEVYIPLSVTSIKERTFGDCESLATINFVGDAPSIAPDAFENVTATVCYPVGNATWTQDKMQNYGGNLTWKAAPLASMVTASSKTTGLQIIPELTDSVYVIGSAAGATIKCSGALKDFVSVAVDGQILSQSDYTVKDGSTVLTILSAYLDKLPVGEHVVTLNYTYGSIDTVLTVVEKEAGKEADKEANVKNMAGKSPDTGDTSAAMAWGLVGLAAVSLGSVMLRKKRKTV